MQPRSFIRHGMKLNPFLLSPHFHTLKLRDWEPVQVKTRGGLQYAALRIGKLKSCGV